MNYMSFKRLMDIIVSCLLLLILSPFFVIVSLLIKIDSSGPVFFKQIRVGKKGKLFHIIKFRTMTDVKRNPAEKQTFSGDSEITNIGNFLRRFKIDETPQIINVFKGDMSLVGPRPALPELYNDLGDIAAERLEVRPGMTGLAQVNGNIFLSWEGRIKFDNKYVESVSLKMDSIIILKTLVLLVVGEEKFKIGK